MIMRSRCWIRLRRSKLGHRYRFEMDVKGCKGCNVKYEHRKQYKHHLGNYCQELRMASPLV